MRRMTRPPGSGCAWLASMHWLSHWSSVQKAGGNGSMSLRRVTQPSVLSRTFLQHGGESEYE